MHFLPENRMCAPPFVTKQCPPIWKILDPPLLRYCIWTTKEWQCFTCWLVWSRMGKQVELPFGCVLPGSCIKPETLHALIPFLCPLCPILFSPPMSPKPPPISSTHNSNVKVKRHITSFCEIDYVRDASLAFVSTQLQRTLVLYLTTHNLSILWLLLSESVNCVPSLLRNWQFSFNLIAVMVAELVHHFIPTIVEKHNYQPANGTKGKKENWMLFDR